MKPVQKVLEDADLKKEDVDEIVLVGGSTRILKIQQLVRDHFNGKVCVVFLLHRKAVEKLGMCYSSSVCLTVSHVWSQQLYFPWLPSGHITVNFFGV